MFFSANPKPHWVRQGMGCLLGLLAVQTETTKRTFWARRWALTLDAIELVVVGRRRKPPAGTSWPRRGGRRQQQQRGEQMELGHSCA